MKSTEIYLLYSNTFTKKKIHSIIGVSFNKHKSKQEHLMKDSVICTIAGGWQKHIHQPYDLVLIGRNQSKEFAIMVWQWLTTDGRNPNPQAHKPQDSTVLPKRKSWIVRSALYFCNLWPVTCQVRGMKPPACGMCCLVRATAYSWWMTSVEQWRNDD
jgi:hypothetical protein